MNKFVIEVSETPDGDDIFEERNEKVNELLSILTPEIKSWTDDVLRNCVYKYDMCDDEVDDYVFTYDDVNEFNLSLEKDSTLLVLIDVENAKSHGTNWTDEKTFQAQAKLLNEVFADYVCGNSYCTPTFYAVIVS